MAAMSMAPLSSQLLRSRRQAVPGDGGGGGSDRERHSSLNATWSGMGSKRLEAAEAHGALRPKSVHEILAQARATVAGPAVGDVVMQQEQQSGLQQPDKLQKIGQESVAPGATTAPASAPSTKRLTKMSSKSSARSIGAETTRATGGAQDVNAFVKRVESGALQSVQEKARARAERLVDQRDPRHGTKRKGAGKALDAAAANQQQMHQKVTKRLQERILTELKRIDTLCPEDPDDVAVAAARRDENTSPLGASDKARNLAQSTPHEAIAFLEATLRHLRTHHQRLNNVMKTRTPASTDRTKAGVPPRVAIVQPSQERKRDAARVGSISKSPDQSAPAGGDTTEKRHAAARRIQHEYRVRRAVRKVKSRYEGKLRATRRELHKLRKEMQGDTAKEPSASAQLPGAGAPLTGDLEAFRTQVAEERARANAAEASIVRWQESEADNLAQIAELREALHAMEKQVRAADVQTVENDARYCGFDGSGHRVQVASIHAGASSCGDGDCSASIDDGNTADELPADVLQMLERAERGKVPAAVGSC